MDKIRILVVDDESRMRKLVRDFLVREGYEVLEAGDGEEALDIFYREKDIALIILDVMMPKRNGFEVCREIRETVLEGLLDPAYETAGDAPDFRAFVDTQGVGRSDRQVPEIIEKVYDSAHCHLNPEAWLDKCLTDKQNDRRQRNQRQRVLGKEEHAIARQNQYG